MSSASAAFTPDHLPDLTGRVYLVTGGNTGLGYETVLQLAIHHARVYMGARSETKARAAIERIRKDPRTTDPDVHFLKLDLADLKNVVEAAKQIQKREEYIHGLVNNAGIMATPYELTVDGYESQFQTNYLSHWLLTRLLEPILLNTAAKTASTPGMVRIVNISSHAHKNAPSDGIDLMNVNRTMGGVLGPVARYGSSKLLNILHAQELDRRYKDHADRRGDVASAGEIWAASIDPGRVDTNLTLRANGNILLRATAIIVAAISKGSSVEKGAYTQLFAVASDAFRRDQSGEFWQSDTTLGAKSLKAKDKDLARALWEWTEREMGKRGFIE